jgi:hypothetical protein
MTTNRSIVCAKVSRLWPPYMTNTNAVQLWQYTWCVFRFYQTPLADHHNIVNSVVSTYTYHLPSQNLHVPENNFFFKTSFNTLLWVPALQCFVGSRKAGIFDIFFNATQTQVQALKLGCGPTRKLGDPQALLGFGLQSVKNSPISFLVPIYTFLKYTHFNL